MMLPHSQVKIFASTDVVDMRFGFDRLAQTVKAAMVMTRFQAVCIFFLIAQGTAHGSSILTGRVRVPFRKG